MWVHLFPSRTQKLSTCTPTILGGRLPGKIGNANTRSLDRNVGAFSAYKWRESLVLNTYIGKYYYFSIDNEYMWVYNRIKSQEGELTMFRYCINVVDNKSGNPMRWLGLGLTLSYSFLG